MILFSLSKGRTISQIINVNGNVTTRKQMPMIQTVIDFRIIIKILSSSGSDE
jgi:hypothetical protein